MEEIGREQISAVMQGANVSSAHNAKERNDARRAAVTEFLNGKPDRPWIQGTVHEMILSDLDGYPEWEKEDGDV